MEMPFSILALVCQNVQVVIVGLQVPVHAWALTVHPFWLGERQPHTMPTASRAVALVQKGVHLLFLAVWLLLALSQQES